VMEEKRGSSKAGVSNIVRSTQQRKSGSEGRDSNSRDRRKVKQGLKRGVSDGRDKVGCLLYTEKKKVLSPAEKIQTKQRMVNTATLWEEGVQQRRIPIVSRHEGVIAIRPHNRPARHGRRKN